MSNLLHRLTNSPISFWLGLILGVLFLWLIYRFRNYLIKAINNAYQKLANVRASYSTGTEIQLQNDIYRFTQKQHIASTLFSLDEIAIEPRVMIPLVQMTRSPDISPTDSVSLSVPYIPDWPELSAFYGAPTMSLLEILQGDGNIILTGHPGSGKTVALAWLAGAICKKAKGLGKLSNLLPIYFHATDIPHLLDDKEFAKNIEEAKDSTVSINQLKVKHATEVVELLIQSISKYTSPLINTKLPRIIHSSIENRRAILLIDRVDELPPMQAKLITEYIRILHEKYPWLRIVVAMSYDDLAGLPSLGFTLIGMAVWDDNERNSLLQKWIQLWMKYISPLDKAHSKKINTNLLKSWLSTNNTYLKPLEYTLKIWSGLSGDVLGTDGPNAIDAYLRRVIGNDIENRRSIEQFALYLLIGSRISGNPNDIEELRSEYKVDAKSSKGSASTEADGQSQSTAEKMPNIEKIKGVEALTTNGLLISYQGSRYGFSHPIIYGYLAGKALSEFGMIDKIEQQPSWTGRNLALYYLSKYGDVNSVIQHYLQDDDILHTNHFIISRWLQVAPKNLPWRTIILRTLATTLQKERETVSLSAKILSAMALSGDKGVSIYFRQLLKSNHANLKQLGALGCGMLTDTSSIDDLNQILQEPSPASIRTASLALAAIGDKRSLEILASNLLNGDEPTRRYAAEALANHVKEGYPALQEGSSMEDLLVRRAVIFGLIRINQPWSIKIVENLQLEDKEWVVRNAAIEVFNELQRRSGFAPTSVQDLTEIQWLIDYASRNDTTIAPGKPAEKLVINALANGTRDEKLFALNYFQSKCDPNTMDIISTTYSKSAGEVRDSAYYLLWLMNLSGIQLPFSLE